MFPIARLKALHERECDLIRASEVQRGLLSGEWSRLERQCERLDRAVSVMQRLLPLGAMAIPLLKLWSSRQMAPRRPLLSRLIGVVSIVQQLAAMGRKLRRL